ncbi:hypothetical protein RI138_13990 [Streptomyces sp. C11-1]|uniref:Uncharacterized protein n=1 Tax=Streptomyces durocortorensis TaxID=2811104 RepID=A0ABY9VVA1_9ACTN|nr:hypothetical protein [Streptomyces durocortorensis]WNF27845.1 hypothetical protein RI138_13990 [Streptomyces durocortorensis]
MPIQARLRTGILTATGASLLIGSLTAAAPAPVQPRTAASSTEAAFVLDADSGKFGATRVLRSAQSSSIQTVKNYVGTATDTQVLALGSQRAVADNTLASSPNKAERAAWAASSTFVDLSWPDLGATRYTVYRDGIEIGEATGHSLRDTAVTPGSEVSYTVVGETKGGVGHTWGLTATVPTDDDPATLAATARQIEAKAKKYTKTTVVWRSFIRPKWATVPKKLGSVSGCKYTSGYKYAGDNRGYSKKITGPRFRAGVRGVIHWNKSSYDLFPKTGWTKVYKAKSGKFVAKRKASTKKIDFRAMTKHNGKTRAVRGTIEATDPFCPSSGLRRAGVGATFDMRLARNGDFYATGKYRKAPDHELYLFGHRGKKHSTKVVHRSKSGSLLCLSQPMCERGTIGNSGGY